MRLYLTIVPDGPPQGYDAIMQARETVERIITDEQIGVTIDGGGAMLDGSAADIDLVSATGPALLVSALARVVGRIPAGYRLLSAHLSTAPEVPELDADTLARYAAVTRAIPPADRRADVSFDEQAAAVTYEVLHELSNDPDGVAEAVWRDERGDLLDDDAETARDLAYDRFAIYELRYVATARTTEAAELGVRTMYQDEPLGNVGPFLVHDTATEWAKVYTDAPSAVTVSADDPDARASVG